MDPDYTAALWAGFQVGAQFFGAIWAVRLLLQMILNGGGRD